MNERIKQLALEAGDYVNEVYTAPVRSKTHGKIWEDGHIGWHTQFNQKFAELIVKECIDQASIGNGHGNNQWDRALTFAANNIKDHFGVK